MKRQAPVPRAFPSPEEFRAWLEEHHASASELLVRCFKTAAAHRGMTYRQALDEALCIGWIDGVRRGVDEASFSVRFTPRKPKSAWSAVNVARFGQLQQAGRLHFAGLAAFRARVKTSYSYENKPKALAPAYVRKFQANRKAWRFFEAQPPWYRRTSAFWVMSAKRPETRLRRLEVLIAHSQRHTGVPPLKPPGGRAATARRVSRV